MYLLGIGVVWGWTYVYSGVVGYVTGACVTIVGVVTLAHSALPGVHTLYDNVRFREQSTR